LQLVPVTLTGLKLGAA